jgi:hypothetical protein
MAPSHNRRHANDEPGLPAGWQHANSVERCNFHWQRPAVYRFCGTPVCEFCARGKGLKLVSEPRPFA